MPAKRKISARKILQVFVTLIVTSGCIVAVLGASKIQETKKLKEVYLHVRNEKQYQFLDKQDLLKNVITSKKIITNKTKLAAVNIRSLERSVYKNPWVSEAQVYVDNQRNMHIYVTQKVPVARIFFENGESFYLDSSLNILPLSKSFTYYTTVVTNVPWYNNDSMNKAVRTQIIKLIKFIEKGNFWNAQIEQIAVTPDMKFELYPVHGTHKILFGDTSRIEEKFSNLFGFYKTVLNKIGWDKYEILDVRYREQVVASPSLPWKAPARGTLSNMDWVKTILGDQAKTTETKTPNATAQKTVTAKVNNPSSPTVTKPTAEKKITQPEKLQPVKTENTKTKTEIKSKENTEPSPKYIYKEQ